MFIYRDQLYDARSRHRGEADIVVAQNRHGPVGIWTLAFLDHIGRFLNIAKELQQ